MEDRSDSDSVSNLGKPLFEMCCFHRRYRGGGGLLGNVHMTQLLLLGKSRVWLRADFQSGSRVLKKGVLNLFLSISMAYNVISCRKVAENTQILKNTLNSLSKSGSRPHKSPKKDPKNGSLNRNLLNFFLLGLVYFKSYRVNPHVQTVQNMYVKGG